MEKSKKYKLIVLGQDQFYLDEITSIVAIRYSSSCVSIHSFNDLKDHVVNSFPVDGIIVQTGHPDFHLVNSFIKANNLNTLIISFSPKDLVAKIDSYFASLDKWFVEVPYLPLHSNLASFVGHTPVDLYIQNDKGFVPAISGGSFLSNENVGAFFGQGEGFFFIHRKDQVRYQEGWDESTLVYFKGNSTEELEGNSLLELVLPILNSTNYHGIPDSDQYLLYCSLERVACYLMDHKEISNEIELTLKKGHYQLKHTTFLMCMNIAAMSALGIGSSVIYFNLTLAALIHDIGTRTYGFEEYEFHDFAMDNMLEESQVSSYMRHGEVAVSLLVKHRSCPRWVAEMVLSHHENDIGQGYPIGLRASSLGQATFIFSYNHHWAETLYGILAKGTRKIDLEVFIQSMPESSDQARNFKKTILNYLNFTPR